MKSGKLKDKQLLDPVRVFSSLLENMHKIVSFSDLVVIKPLLSLNAGY